MNITELEIGGQSKSNVRKDKENTEMMLGSKQVSSHKQTQFIDCDVWESGREAPEAILWLNWKVLKISW